MPLFLVPIIAGGAAVAGGAAAYGAATQEESGDYAAGSGGRELDAHQIYERLHAGPGTGSLVEGQSSANTLKDHFGERVAQMDSLAQRMDAAWQGDASQAAKAGANPLKQWLQDSEGKLHESSHSMGSQLDAFNTTINRVQPVPAKPPESDFLNDITPWQTDTDREISEYNAKAQANVEAYNAYYQLSSANGQSMPKYTTVDGEFGDVEMDGGGGVDTDNIVGGPYPGSFPGGGGSGGGAGGGGAYDSGGIGGGPYPGGGVPGGGGSGGGAGGGAGGAGGGSYDPGGIGGGPYPGGGYPGGSGSGGSGAGGGIGGSYPGGPGYEYDPAEWDDSTSASRFTPPTSVGSDFGTGGGTTPVGTAPGLGSGGGPGGGSVGTGGSGGAVGGFGPGAPGGPGSAGAATGAAAPGSASGAGAGRAMGGPAAAGMGARGTGGMPMGAMGGGGGRSQGAEDEEHQTKFLVDEDGDSLFGSDELTTPPVIGE
ncbi:PPE domain-containing protein [Saccharomonospora piscinae]|uniref:PPE domain-containing protein n=1 Tax=Saccharomonospora piscinae TaxID=687388 RepID=UPI000463788F|nr:PPE domain-containing protein [Saccharomonospora piscinae]